MSKSCGGGFKQLVMYGCADIYFTGNPENGVYVYGADRQKQKASSNPTCSSLNFSYIKNDWYKEQMEQMGIYGEQMEQLKKIEARKQEITQILIDKYNLERKDGKENDNYCKNCKKIIDKEIIPEYIDVIQDPGFDSGKATNETIKLFQEEMKVKMANNKAISYKCTLTP
jgi:hypothetical protein